MKIQILHLDPHDDFHSARDKIGWTQTDRLILVWPANETDGRRPAGATAMVGPHRRLNLVLLHRHAARLGARLALVTQDSEVAAEAGEIGVPVFASVEASQREVWRYRRPFSLGRSLSRRAGRADEGWPHALRSSPRALPATPHPLARALGYGLFALALAALATLAVFIAPAATISLSPASQPIRVTTPIVADPARTEIDTGAGLIPARFITVEVKSAAQTAATGLIEIPSGLAEGTVVFSNLVGQSVYIPAGSGVRTTSGTPVRFVTTRDATLPASVGASAEAPIRAVTPGPQGNVTVGQVNAVDGPLAAQAAVINPSPTSGGQSQPATAVTAADRERLRAQVLAQIAQQAEGQVVGAIGPNEFVVPASLTVTKVLDETYDRYAGERADSLSLEMRALARAVAVDEQLADTVAFTALLDRIGPGLSLLPEQLAFTRSQSVTVDEAGRAAFEVTAAGAVAPSIDLDGLRTATLGMPVDEARAYFATQVPLIRPPQITVWPNWYGRVPYLALRVNLAVDIAPSSR